jgi:hypothetical protein
MKRRKGASAVSLTGLWGLLGLGVGAVLSVSASVAPAQRVVCAAWPGEPDPLPRIDDPDPFLARWAQLRVRELSGLVSELEGSDPSASTETWQHLRCLDPSGALASGAVEPAPAAVVAAIPPVETAPRSRDPDWSPIDATLGAAEALVRDARFEQALQTAERIRPRLVSVENVPGANLRRTQLEVLSATAQIALGRDDAARESFERALAADPELELDARSTSPKIRRVFDTVRRDPGSPKP